MKKFHANVLKLTNLRASYKKSKSRMKYSYFDETSEYSSFDTGLSEVSSYESSSMSDSSRPWRSTNSSSSAAQQRRLRRHQRRARKDPKKLEVCGCTPQSRTNSNHGALERHSQRLA